MDRTVLSWPGAPLGLASAALFGASTPFAKLLLGSVDPWLLAGLLYLGSGAGLALVQRVRRPLGIGTAEAPLRRADLPWLLLVVLVGGVIGPAAAHVRAAPVPRPRVPRCCSISKASRQW